MLPLRQANDIETAALNDSRPGHRDILEAAAALRNYARRAAGIERRQESVAECLHLGKGVRLAALVNHGNDGPLFYRHLVGFEVPARIGRPLLGPVDKIAQNGRIAKGAKRNIVTQAT